jgi:hypothetical protein
VVQGIIITERVLVLENRSYAIRVTILKSKEHNYSIEERTRIFHYSKDASREKFAKSRTKI